MSLRALILTDEELRELIDSRVSELLNGRAVHEVQENGRVMNTREAASYLGLKPGSILKARRLGRLKGKMLNGLEWGFEQKELDRYKQFISRKKF